MRFKFHPWVFILGTALLITTVSSTAKDTLENTEENPTKPVVRSTIITGALATLSTVNVVEHAIGELEAVIRPEVSAEVSARYLRAHVMTGDRVIKGQLLAELDAKDYSIAIKATKAKIAQLNVLLANQNRTVTRHAKLLKARLVSTDTYDASKAQLDLLKEELNEAKEHLRAKRHSLSKTRILATHKGIIDAELASPGDFLEIGDPVFRLIKTQRLRARLPLPEALATRVSAGQQVRLASPMDPNTVITSTVQDIRPTVDTLSRSIHILSIVDNPGHWLPGGSVTGEITLSTRENAVVVPKGAIVLRPVGKIVYVIEEGMAHQQAVATGEYIDTHVEILSGLQAGQTVAVHGAGFLTDGAPVTFSDGDK